MFHAINRSKGLPVIVVLHCLGYKPVQILNPIGGIWMRGSLQTANDRSWERLRRIPDKRKVKGSISNIGFQDVFGLVLP